MNRLLSRLLLSASAVICATVVRAEVTIPAAASATVPYVFVDESTGPVIQGNLLIQPDYKQSEQTVVYASVNPKSRVKGQATVTAGGLYYIVGYGFIEKEGAKACESPLIVNAVNGMWPSGSKVVVIYSHARSFKTLTCTVTLR